MIVKPGVEYVNWYEALEKDIADLKKRVDAFDPDGSEYVFVTDLWDMIERLKSEYDDLWKAYEEDV